MKRSPGLMRSQARLIADRMTHLKNKKRPILEPARDLDRISEGGNCKTPHTIIMLHAFP